MSDTLLEIVLLVPCLVIAIVFHEVAHGWAALALGDPTAKERRRLTLNPLRHVDPMGTLVVPGFLALVGGPVFGWAKPVPVNFNRLRNPRLGMMLVAAAGPATNFLLAALAAVLIGLTIPANATLDLAGGVPKVIGADGSLLLFGSGLVLFILINTFLALFNLLPIPPFDGSHIVEGALPRAAARQYAKLRSVGMLLFVVLIAASWAFPDANIIGRVIGPPVTWVIDHFLILSAWVASA
jgi:Zn-dependent protease